MARSRNLKVPTGEPSPFNILGDTHPKTTKSQVQDSISLNSEPNSDGSETSDEDSEIHHKPVPRSVREDIAKFEESFNDLAKQYRLIDRIGEGEKQSTTTKLIG